MNEEVAAALDREFGYVPQEGDGEKWVVWQEHTLIVVHPEQRPKLYERGGHGRFIEMDPWSPWHPAALITTK